ncbi:hypothetical protein BLNAU_22502 [Blattamonas nauphoetae]|uniref:Serine-threonine/tyrosine-protein kinase catalytic domain-containing protein n=1 Tax=Blattamonas nauphoetae TaxID=2049346 RepID=A0ABQ9WSW5_9EUKA|nr:hypothetical protein BLNAU_22502 [Blattamonas nauphoetae]
MKWIPTLQRKADTLARPFLSLVSMVRDGCKFNEELLQKASKFLSSIRQKFNALSLSDNFVKAVGHNSPNPSAVFIDSMIVLLFSSHPSIFRDSLSLISTCILYCSSSTRLDLVSSNIIPRMLSTPLLQDLSVVDDQDVMNDVLELFKWCIRLTATDAVQFVWTPSDTETDSIRDVIYHNPHVLSWIRVSQKRVVLLVDIIGMSAFHQPTLDVIRSSQIPILFQLRFSKVENENTNAFILELVCQTIRTWKNNGADTWRRGRILMQKPEQEGFGDRIELTLQHDTMTPDTKRTLSPKSHISLDVPMTSHADPSLLTTRSVLTLCTNNETRMETDCQKSNVLRLADDAVISSSIQIRSEEIALIGNSSRLLFQHDNQPSSDRCSWSPNETSTKAEPKKTPKVGSDGLSAAAFMFEVFNSTFSVTKVHAIMNSERNGICSVTGSTVRFSSSSITSNGDLSPFMITSSENEGTTLGSTIVLADVTHHSMSGHVAPFVGLTHPQHPLVSPRAMKRGDGVTSQAEWISIVGTGLWFKSKDLIGGTGPLFSFGMTIQDSSFASSRCGLRMETSLVRSTLVNMTSSSRMSLGMQQFGSGVNQRVIGSCVDQSTNHDSGTGMMSPHLGGNVMCLNTSFSSCIRTENDDTNLEYSFENRTQTSDPGRLSSVASEVTTVTFSLCTFNTMTVAAGAQNGGGAISLKLSPSSLTIRTCFFLKCTCTAQWDDGGAVFFSCSSGRYRPVSVTHSSFTQCTAKECAGTLCVIYPKSLLLDNCFIDYSTAEYDGAAIVDSENITISNTAFVDCSSTNRGGALTLFNAATLSISFCQFRGCSSTSHPNGKDIYFGPQSTQIDTSKISSCDTTSATPNVWFNGNSQSSISLVPRTGTTPTVNSVVVTIDNNEATVVVETEQAIKGTLSLLLNGSIVPRLVHVVFGDKQTPSTVGTAVVSSGPRGILPSASYTPHKSSFAADLFPPPTVRTADASLKDWNTTEIVVTGVNFWEENYWMVVEGGGEERNITLTRSDSRTLTGTGLLYPSTAEDRLKWATEYEVITIMSVPGGQQIGEEATLSGTVTFTTPHEVVRLSKASCSLGRDQQKSALVTLKGVKLEEGKAFTVTVQKKVESAANGEDILLSGTLSGASSSTEHTHSVEIFGVSNAPLSFDTTYLITEFRIDGVLSALDSDVTFFVPAEPARITGATCWLNGKKDELIVELRGSALSSSSDLSVVMTGTSHSVSSSGGLFNVSSTKCFVKFSIGLNEDESHVVFGGHYDLLSVGSGSSSVIVTPGLVVDVDHPPRIASIVVPEEVTTSTFALSVSGSNLPSGKTYTVTLTSDLTFEMLFSSTIAGASTVKIGGSGQVQYDTSYTIKSIILSESGKDDEHILFSELTFKTPLGPTLSSISCDFDSSDPNSVKVSFSTERMPVADFKLAVENVASPSETVELTITSSALSSRFVVVKVYKQAGTLKYGTNYRVTQMWSGSVVVVLVDDVFSTPPEPIRITSVSCSLGGVQEKSALVSLKGVKLGGGMEFNMTVQKMIGSAASGKDIVLSGRLSGASSSTDHIHSVEIFGISNAPLSFDTTYLITKFVVKDSVSTVDADSTFLVPAEPSRLTSLDTSLQYSTDDKNATISLSGIGMEGDYNLTLSVNSTSTNNVTLTATFDAAGRGVVTAVLFDLSDSAIVDLSYNTRYEVVDVTKGSNSIWFENDLAFTTIPVPPRLVSISLSEYAIGMDSVELSFDSIALPSEETFKLTLESVHSDSTTPHQKVVTLETDGSEELKRHRAELYPFETESGKKKGQLEYDTKYKVIHFTLKSTPIHFEDIPTRIQTPMEPARVEKCTNRVLNAARTELVVSLEGRKLRANLGFLSLSAESGSWTSIGEIEADDETHCTVRFLTADDEDPTHIKFGKEYTLKTVSTDETNFVVNAGIRIEVPFPPKVTDVKFSFSNSLHTTCFVVLTGDYLIVGNSLNVTLSNSLSFIATITSETEARSSEQLIGWPTTLKHNTQYTITSIEAVNDADGMTGFDPSISNTTGSLPDDVVIFVDSDSSSDSSLFCGDRTRPCTAIEDGWKIVEGVGISTFSISILHNTTMTEQVKILSDHEVVIESKPTTKPELFLSPSLSSLSKLEEEGMVDVCGGRLRVHDVDVVLSDSASVIFIRMVGGHLTIETCSLIGPKGTSTSTNIESSDDLCEWGTGALILEDSTTTITSTRLTHLSAGAINMKGGSLIVETSTFHDNTPHSSSFPSLRHNIMCLEGGEIEIGSLNGGDGMETPSAWISAGDCSLTAKDAISRSPFFIPTLSSSSTSKLNKTEKAFILTINGATLIPCSLMLEVFEKMKDGTEGQSKQFPLALNTTTSFNDSTIELSLPLSSLSSFDASLEWDGRLVFGKDEKSSSFTIQLNAADRRSQAVRDNMKWWLPLVLSLVILLILIVIIVFVCWRRRKQPKPLTQLDQPQELGPIDDKIEIACEDGVTMEVSKIVESTRMDGGSNVWGVETDLAECLHCGDEFATSFVSKKKTLYEHLHRERKMLANRRQCEIQLARGLDQIARMAAFSKMLQHVTSHRILIGKDGSLNVNLEKPEGHGVVSGVAGKTEGRSDGDGTAGASTGMGGQNGMNEAMRWQAPEEGKAHLSLDLQQVGVFRLGLLLYEIETGSVPFGETDAVNAHRQLEAGMELAMEKVQNKSMAEVITSCLQVDPKLRPSFASVVSTLEGIAPDADDNGLTIVS